MGLADRFGGIADKARKAVAENADKIEGGLEKAARVADQRTGGKHSDKIEKGVRVAKQRLAEQKRPPSDGPMAP
jgi:hypothetical protein